MIENFFQKVLMLKTIHREGWKENLQINYPESVADHSYSVSVMSICYMISINWKWRFKQNFIRKVEYQKKN